MDKIKSGRLCSFLSGVGDVRNRRKGRYYIQRFPLDAQTHMKNSESIQLLQNREEIRSADESKIVERIYERILQCRRTLIDINAPNVLLIIQFEAGMP